MNKKDGYGRSPEPVEFIEIDSDEMMLWMYCPIKAPKTALVIPPNLEHVRPLIDLVYNREIELDDKYIYVTAKRAWVSTHTANRRGWHCDGFLSDDINYIWHDCHPTEFWIGKTALTQDDNIALEEMEELTKKREYKETSHNKYLYRLDEFNIHRVNTAPFEGFRTFIKISISDKFYDHAGNSINHNLNLEKPSRARRIERNNPSTCCFYART